jgi:hypothetical protein
MALYHGAPPTSQQPEPLIKQPSDLPGFMALTRAAANSMASGTPSTRRQISSTAGD